jgi:hypothetical protein
MYYTLFDEDMGRALDKEMGGGFEKLIFTCLQDIEEEYDPFVHNDEKAKKDVVKLHKKEDIFKILCASPPEYIHKLNLLYALKYGLTLTRFLETEFGGATGPAVMFMLNMKIKPYEEIAKLIDNACKGFGTNELLLTCTIIRYQKILKEVMAAHEELFGKTVQERVKSEVKGEYRALLLTVLDSANQN